ncbi:MAG TPA: SUMF1/EgtB/PvdO family nonheme iron enzyme [Saprospiraceae bacterium]|nr:SUMF1/EgtB/PvdO family nonheme iron enzyme [Saprospiraceae bacterium]HMQ81905.1 SUMF1/EgtB/PvdO family nonheme iron enzyme [Saprospiraceae bacterium]
MKEKLKKLIEKGKAKQVLQLLLDHTKQKSDDKGYNDLIILSNQFQEFSTNKNLGIYSSEEARRQTAILHRSLLSILDEIENVDQIDFPEKPEPGLKNNRRLISWLIPLSVLGLLIVGAIFAYQFSQQPANLTEKVEPPKDSTNGSDSVVAPIQTKGSQAKKLEKPITGGATSKKFQPEAPVRPTSINKIHIRPTIDSISSFSIAKYETTIGEYLLFCQTSSHTFPYEKVDTTNKNLPMTYVSRQDAQAYCVYIGGRLPTVAEWEYAASNGTANFTFSGSDSASEVAWFGAQTGGPQVVGKKKPNELGIYDMCGNVKEWCSDPYPEKPGYYIAKGGGWKSYSKELEIRSETIHLKGFKNDNLGFRVVFD